MTRPQEKDYTSQAAYCRALEECCSQIEAEEAAAQAALNIAHEQYEELREELAALKNLVAKTQSAKGRYHSQIAWANLYEACGLPFAKPMKESHGHS